MKYEQLNLYGDDKERFKARGKTPEELEKETRENTLENRIIKFIDEEEKKKKIKREDELNSNQIIELTKKFIGDSEEEDFYSVKKILVKKLLQKGYSLSSLVMDVEIKEKNLHLFGKEENRDIEKSPADEKPTKEEIRKIRDKLPGPYKGLPTGDLD